MIVIDENAETRLLAELEAFKGKVGSPRCLHLIQPGLHRSGEQIVELLNSELPHSRSDELSVLVFFCEDGDVFALSPHIAPSHARAVLAQTGDIGQLYELVHGWMPLLQAVQRKVDGIRERMEKNSGRIIEEKQGRMRHAILHRQLDPALVQSIPERRMKHERPEVMVVEDDLLSRRLVFHALREHCNVVTLNDAQHALEIYAEHAPDMLLLDIGLPDVNGHDILNCIIAIDPSAYVVMLSGNGDRANVLQAVEEGASGFVGKPFSKEKLLKYLERCPFFRTSPCKNAYGVAGLSSVD